MLIQWYGHASFRLTDSRGVSVITDPYSPERAGFKAFTETSDIVIISSANDVFHDRADLIPGRPHVINALELAMNHGGHVTKYDIDFRAIQAMEHIDHPSGHPDQNGMYRFMMDGIHIGHMGDMGNALSDDQIAFFQGVDVLLALTGGFPTLALDDLKVLIDATQPKYIVPMHYRTIRYRPADILWLPSFLEYFDKDQVDLACHHTATLHKEDLPASTRILVLDYT